MARRERTSSDDPIEMGGVIIHPNSRIGSYVFIREVGSGGMARVLLAKDPAGDLVALKVLRKSRFKTGIHRFRREFRALSRIKHPNVISVEAYGDLYGHPYIAMEYVDGLDLHTQIRKFRSWDWRKRWQRVEEILIDLCRALDAVHRRGLVHRDLKPSNVLISLDGVCKLTDFGIVKDLDPSDPFKSTTLVGTWAYASPEQIRGEAIDHRSDLYSLGIILFAMLTGKRPFVAKDMHGYLELHSTRPPPSPREVNRAIPRHLDEICRKLLAKESRDRYQSAQEILYRLEAEEREPLPENDSEWSPPLVGRDVEVELLTNAVAGLTNRRGGVIFIEGEDGSGKSRLIDLTIDRARTLGLAHYRFEFQQDEPVFSKTVPFARAMAKELGEAAPPELTTAVQEFIATSTSRMDNLGQILTDGVVEGLRTLMEDRPQVLVIDDLHEANARALDLLRSVIRTLIADLAEPLLVVASSRPKANPAADSLISGGELGMKPREILLSPLSREDLARIVFDLVGDSRGARLLAQRLHRETEGNALFVTELLRSLRARGVIAGTNDSLRLTLEPEEIATGHLEIPPSIRQMLRSRLEALRPEDRRVLEGLSVGGREVDFDVLMDVLTADEEEVLDSLDRLLAAGMIRERRTGDLVLHSVSHRKFADVVYRTMQDKRRADLHRRVAGALELHYSHNPAALEVVGEHYRRAGDAGRAYRYLVAAAKRLCDRSLLQEAWDLTEKAGLLEDSASTDLNVMDFRSFRRDNLTIRGRVLYNRAEWEQAENTFRAVLLMAEQDSDARASCQARQELATVLRRRGLYEESRAMAEAALDESRRLHFREGVADALHNLAALAWSQGDLDECERVANEGLLVAQETKLADRRAELLLALTTAQATRGHLAAATSGLTEAEGIFRELRKKRPRCLALANIAELLTLQGEPLQARQRAHVAVQLANDLDYKLGQTVATRTMAVAALDLGLYDEAWKGLERSLRLAERIQTPEEMLACLVALSRLCAEQEDGKLAQRYAERGLKVAITRDPERYTPLLQAQLARALAFLGKKEATSMIAVAERTLPSLHVPRRCQVQLALGWAYMYMEDTKSARALLRTVMQVAGSRGFRLLALESRAVMAKLSPGEESALHQSVGRELAKDFSMSLPADMARAFSCRPFLTYFGIDGEEDEEEQDDI